MAPFMMVSLYLYIVQVFVCVHACASLWFRGTKSIDDADIEKLREQDQMGQSNYRKK